MTFFSSLTLRAFPTAQFYEQNAVVFNLHSVLKSDTLPVFAGSFYALPKPLWSSIYTTFCIANHPLFPEGAYSHFSGERTHSDALPTLLGSAYSQDVAALSLRNVLHKTPWSSIYTGVLHSGASLLPSPEAGAHFLSKRGQGAL
jgi:hypothetical protein